jgi:RNA polymerase sigma-70 factor (ECF subfamily)
MAQRLVRAKRKIQEARIPYEIPHRDRLPERLDAVRRVLYLIFNEGYLSSSGENLIRSELCSEAIQLARTLHQLMPGNPENMGLLALMLLHDSRRHARANDVGELVPLEEQDRSLWDRAEIAEGMRLVEQALGRRNPGPYQIQAAIAAVHAEAATASDTDWQQIAGLYSVLQQIQPSPIVAMNHAAAIAMGYSLERGLELLDQAAEKSGELKGYYLYHAARADLLRRMLRIDEALQSYRHALALATNEVERTFLMRRTDALTSQKKMLAE